MRKRVPNPAGKPPRSLPKIKLALISIAALAGIGCTPMSFLITPVDRPMTLREFVVQRDSFWAARKVALIEVEGVLRLGRVSSPFGESTQDPVATFRDKLDHAAKDKNVRAVVVRINSPGGGVTASDLMYTELKRFKEESQKPVVASMVDVAASGGYYLACAADRIFALPTTVTGSIGVIMILPDLTGIMSKLGIRTNVVKSGAMKDAGSPFREMNDKERAGFQKMIDAMYARFVSVVAERCAELDEQGVRELADGRVYLAPEAQQLGLIDEIGTLHDAVAEAKRMAGIEDEPILVVQYGRRYEHRPNIYARSPSHGAQLNLVNIELPAWLRGASPKFMYVWAPGW